MDSFYRWKVPLQLPRSPLGMNPWKTPPALRFVMKLREMLLMDTSGSGKDQARGMVRVDFTSFAQDSSYNFASSRLYFTSIFMVVYIVNTTSQGPFHMTSYTPFAPRVLVSSHKTRGP